MRAKCIYVVSIQNQAFANTGINLHARLVHATQIEDTTYVETNKGWSEQLSNLGNTGDGVFDVDIDKRWLYGADAVVLIRKQVISLCLSIAAA
jgi:hypothetical protein